MAKASHEHAMPTGRGGAIAPPVQHDMAHEMGHGVGMNMQAGRSLTTGQSYGSFQQQLNERPQ